MQNKKMLWGHILVLTAAVLLTVSCGSPKQRKTETAKYPVTVKNTRLYAFPEKIVSLDDDVTEILSKIGLDEFIVAVNHECGIPDKKELPQAGKAAYPDMDVLKTLAPDLLITTYPLSGKMMEELSAMEIQVLVLGKDDDWEETLKLLNGNPDAGH